MPVCSPHCIPMRVRPMELWLARLVLAACLAYLWIIYLGAIARRDRWDRIIHRTDRCDWRLFQRGLHLLDHWLNESIRIEVAFCPLPPLSAGTEERPLLSWLSFLSLAFTETGLEGV